MGKKDRRKKRKLKEITPRRTSISEKIPPLKPFYIWLILTIILALGFFLRVYRIHSVPPGFHIDEAMNGLCALDILENKERPVYFSRLWGLDVMHPYLSALAFYFSGVKVEIMRLISALAGTLTIWGTYLLGALLFNPLTGLFSAALLAFSRWHINFSRIGCHWGLPPLFLVFSFYWLFRGLQTNKPRDFIISGIIFGAGFYTYFSFRVVPLLLLLFLLFVILKQRNFLSRYFRPLLCFFALSILITLPLIIYALTSPEVFFMRSKAVAVTAIKDVLTNTGKVLLMFGVRGDSWPVHNIPGKPMLFLPVFLCFVAGLIISLRQLWQDINAEKNFFLCAWLIVGLLPSVFSANAPHSLRVLIVVPVVCIFCGLALSSAYNYLFQRYGKLVYAGLLIFFMGSGYYEVNAYFKHWANDESVKNGFDHSTLALLRRFFRLSTSHIVFLPQHLLAYPSATFLIRTEKPAIYAQYNDESFVFSENPPMDVIYVFSVQDSALGILDIFRNIYPQAEKIGEIMGPEPGSAQKFCELYLLKRTQLRATLSSEEKTRLNSVLSQVRNGCESTPWLKDQLPFCYERRKWQ